MAKGKHKDYRDFGGSGKEDWFKLHEDIDPQKGLTPAQARRVADFLRIVGNAAKIDDLGGKGRKGVYYRKEKGRQQINIGTVPRTMFLEWFRERTGTDRESFYESTVSNFISQNPHLISSTYSQSIKSIVDSVQVSLELGIVLDEVSVHQEFKIFLYVGQFGSGRFCNPSQSLTDHLLYLVFHGPLRLWLSGFSSMGRA